MHCRIYDLNFNYFNLSYKYHYPVSNFKFQIPNSTFQTAEKHAENNLLCAMRMMGMGEAAYWVSWLVCAVVLSVVAAVLAGTLAHLG